MSPDRYGDRLDGYPPRIDYDLEARLWIIGSDASYRLKDGRVSTIRAGFSFDFASVPRAFLSLRPSIGTSRNRYDIAALWHDWLYAKGTIQGQPITRKEADRVFLEIMHYVGCSWWVRHTMYRAVRIGGWAAWNRYRKAEQL